jgi:Tfp pilus assembly protein PilF
MMPMKRPRAGLLVSSLLALASCVSYRDMRAKNAYLKGDIDTAEALTDSSLQSDPTDLQARRLGAKIASRRGTEALNHGDAAAAKTFFEKAVKLYPADEVAERYLDMLQRDEAAGQMP